jgi:ParB family chromosome partitioning protein
MSTKRLGRGLDALIPSGSESTDRTTGITTVRIDKIHPNPYQPRLSLDPERLQELAHSIAESGMIQPIIVTKNENAEYELIAGERRLEAAKLANFTEVPVIIRCVSPREQLQFALIENVQRENLNPMEEALAYQQLQNQFNLTHNDIARYVGKERSTITNSIRLLKLEPAIQNMISEERLSQGHARVLLQLPPDKQVEFAGEILRRELSVRQTEQLARSYLSDNRKEQKKIEPKNKEYLEEMSEALTRYYASHAHITAKSRGGSVVFTYKNDDELQKLLNKLLQQK